MSTFFFFLLSAYLCGAYDVKVVNCWNVALEVQQLECHVFYGYWENLKENRQVLLHGYYLQAKNGDAFPLEVPQLDLHGYFHVYYLQAWNDDAFLLNVLQLELHGPSHGWWDGLLILETLLVYWGMAYLQEVEDKI